LNKFIHILDITHLTQSTNQDKHQLSKHQIPSTNDQNPFVISDIVICNLFALVLRSEAEEKLL